MDDRAGDPPAPASWDDCRRLRELSSSGLLWLINRVVFHPRGFALALVPEDRCRWCEGTSEVAVDGGGVEPCWRCAGTGEGDYAGFRLLGDGSEPWRFADPDGDWTEDDAFAAVEAFIAAHRAGA